MGTSATIKVVGPPDLYGRIGVHYDGYPENIRPKLERVLERGTRASDVLEAIWNEVQSNSPVRLNNRDESEAFWADHRYVVNVDAGTVTGTDDLV